MRLFNSLLAAGSAAALLAGGASAQLSELAYSAHWQPQSNPVVAGFSGPSIFISLDGTPNFAGVGDAIRRCFGVDTTQGGRNESQGVFEHTHFTVIQGFAAGNPIPGSDIGLVSVQAASDSDLAGDACFSPFFASVGNTGGHALSAAAILGNQGNTMAFPFVTQFGFQWVGTGTTTFAGLSGPNVIGTTTGMVAGASTAVPLLVNVIYEIQGPLNGGPANNQYYLASTDELTGDGGNAAGGNMGAQFATGGVTNGNSMRGMNLFGVDAAMSGAISHSRLFSSSAGFLIGSIPQNIVTGGIKPGDVELGGFIAFQTTGLWGINNGSAGAGGNDWQASVAPVSVVDLRFNDHLAGAATNPDVLACKGGVGGLPAAGFDPCIFFNQSFFVWSATPSGSMLNTPMSWDDLNTPGLGALVFPQPGSIVLGPQVTSREGPQTIPANFDAVTTALLSVSSLSLGSSFTCSDDIFLDGTIVVGGTSLSAFWEGMFGPITSGVSGFSGGAIQVVGTPNPNLAGQEFGIAALGLQVSACTGLLSLTEIGNSLTINFQ